MNISNQTKILILIIIVLLIVLFIGNTYYKEPIQNVGSLSGITESEFNEPGRYNPTLPLEENIATEESRYRRLTGETEDERYRRLTRSKNQAKEGEYKKSDYMNGVRGNGSVEFDDFFDKNNNMIEDVYTGNDDFVGDDETKGMYATYTPGKKIKMTDEEMFNVDNLLPKEVNDDWFDVPEEPISVKNRHLININRPISINTIGTSNKNASYDIRGTIPNPKFIVSPFLNSSIEPDINNKGFGC